MTEHDHVCIFPRVMNDVSSRSIPLLLFADVPKHPEPVSRGLLETLTLSTAIVDDLQGLDRKMGDGGPHF